MGQQRRGRVEAAGRGALECINDLLGRDDHSAADDELECLIDRDVQIDRLALLDSHGKARERHRGSRDQNTHDRFVGRAANVEHAVAGDHRQRPHTLARIFDGDDAGVLDLPLAEHEIRDLFDRGIHVAHQREAVNDRFEAVPKELSHTGGEKLAQQVQREDEEQQEHGNDHVPLQVGEIHPHFVDSLGGGRHRIAAKVCLDCRIHGRRDEFAVAGHRVANVVLEILAIDAAELPDFLGVDDVGLQVHRDSAGAGLERLEQVVGDRIADPDEDHDRQQGWQNHGQTPQHGPAERVELGIGWFGGELLFGHGRLLSQGSGLLLLTISHEGPGKDGDVHGLGSGDLERLRRFAAGRAGGHYIVNQQHAGSIQIIAGPQAKSVSDVSRPLTRRKLELGQRIALPSKQTRGDRSTEPPADHGGGDFWTAGSTTNASRPMHRNRSHDVNLPGLNSLAGGRPQQSSQGVRRRVPLEMLGL